MLRYQGVSAFLRTLLGGVLWLCANTALAQSFVLSGSTTAGEAMTVTITGVSGLRTSDSDFRIVGCPSAGRVANTSEFDSCREVAGSESATPALTRASGDWAETATLTVNIPHMAIGSYIRMGYSTTMGSGDEQFSNEIGPIMPSATARVAVSGDTQVGSSVTATISGVEQGIFSVSFYRCPSSVDSSGGLPTNMNGTVDVTVCPFIRLNRAVTIAEGQTSGSYTETNTSKIVVGDTVFAIATGRGFLQSDEFVESEGYGTYTSGRPLTLPDITPNSYQFRVGNLISPLELPSADGGASGNVYRLEINGGLPAGLEAYSREAGGRERLLVLSHDQTRYGGNDRIIIRGTPMVVTAGSITITYTVTDGANDSVSKTFTIEIRELSLTVTSGSDEQTIPRGDSIAPITLTAAEFSGNPNYSFVEDVGGTPTDRGTTFHGLSVTADSTDPNLAQVTGRPLRDIRVKIRATFSSEEKDSDDIVITRSGGLALVNTAHTCVINAPCNATVTASGVVGTGSVAYTSTGSTLPTGVTASGASISGMATAVGTVTYTLMFTVTDDFDNTSTTFPFTLTVQDVVLSVDSTGGSATQNVTRGDAITQITLTSDRFTNPPTYSFVEDMGGTLMDRGPNLHGLSVAADSTDARRAVVSGMPRQTGTIMDTRTFTFKIRATSGAQMKDSGDIAITQDATARPSLAETARTCFTDVNCGFSVDATGAVDGSGTTTVAWADTSQTLPTGVSLSGNTFSGQASDSTQVGMSFTLTFTITEGFDGRQTQNLTFTLSVDDAGLDTTSNLSQMVTPVNNFTDITFTALGFATAPNYVFVVGSSEMGTSYSGLTLSGNGTNTATVSGTPTGGTTLTTLDFMVKATAGSQSEDSDPISITLDPGTPPSLSVTSGQCFVDLLCNRMFTVNGGLGTLRTGQPSGVPDGVTVTISTDQREVRFGGKATTATGSPFMLTFVVTEDYPDGGSFADRETRPIYELTVRQAGVMVTPATTQMKQNGDMIDTISVTAVNFDDDPTYTLVEGRDSTGAGSANLYGLSVAADSANPDAATVSGTPTRSVIFQVRVSAGASTTNIQAEYSEPITITVNNTPQVGTSTPADLSLTLNLDANKSRRVSFVDDDMGDTITCRATSDANAVATVPSETAEDGTTKSCVIVVTPVGRGSAEISVTATDSSSRTSAAKTFMVTVSVREGGLDELILQVGARANNTRRATITGERYSVSSSRQAVASARVDDTGLVTVNPLSAGDTVITVTACDEGDFNEAGCGDGAAVASQTFRVSVSNPPPAASGGGGSSGVVVILAAAGAYYFWKQRQIANGADPAAMALLPDVSFDLDKKDNRAFYTKMNWKNGANSAWQLRGNATMHTKYDGELLDWKADSHIGYRLRGKFGDVNPYVQTKFVADDPQNEAMEETYTVGLNYALSNRFSVQFLQPDDEIWRYSLKTEVHLPRGVSLQLNQPNSDLWRYSANLNWRVSERIGLNLSQPDNELPNYGFGIQWRNKSKIRYGISGETGNNSYRFTGSYDF